ALWEEWEKIYINLFNENHKADAKAFYKQHEEELLKGTEVLWEEKLSYYDLMVMLVTEGEASFNSELQNDPIDPENATFNTEWFDYYDPELMDWKSSEFIFVGANDPSLGKNKKSDTSSIINLALSLKTGYMYVVDADVEKRKPDVIIKDVIELSRRLKRDYLKGFYKFGVETVQFQYFFKDVMAKKSVEEGEYIPIEEIQSSVNKMLRIESLQPLIKNKYIKFNRNHKTLLKQLEEFPMGRNDDAPDGLQMAVQLAQSIKGVAVKIGYKRVAKRRFQKGKGAY
ncbi:MAG: phage terminase large subunit, partial [Roseburia sp.]|nr:phage terminase large subunit [Roseburia sp.]